MKYYLTEEGKKYILGSTQKKARQKAERLKELLRSMQQSDKASGRDAALGFGSEGPTIPGIR